MGSQTGCLGCRKLMKWSETESKDYLMWSLEGKALDFFTITYIEKKNLFERLLKVEARFGVKELTETPKAGLSKTRGIIRRLGLSCYDVRIEQHIVSALKEFAERLQISPQSNSQSSPTETKQILDAKKKKSITVSFSVGHFDMLRKNRAYKAWFSKQQSKADNLNDQGRDGKNTHPSPKR